MQRPWHAFSCHKSKCSEVVQRPVFQIVSLLAHVFAVCCHSVRAVSHYAPLFDASLSAVWCPSVHAISHYAASSRRVLEHELRHI